MHPPHDCAGLLTSTLLHSKSNRGPSSQKGGKINDPHKKMRRNGYDHDDDGDDDVDGVDS